MARPLKSHNQARAHRVIFRVDDAALDALRAGGGRNVGLSLTEWAGAKVIGGRVSVQLGSAPQESPGLFQLRQELSRVGVNLNQIARRLNMTGELRPDELTDCCVHLDEILRRLL